MRENIGKINELLPAIFQIQEDKKEINLYIFSKDEDITPVKTVSKHLFEGTKKERDAYIEGMHGLIDISTAFDDFMKTLGKKK